ncbi:PUA-like domain-containing protein [Rhodocollybia butyracea]|uniref:PUA-like domain-containing protein n=1 Tax=Rhodocollybia butyracea TaxID=206335 RepID=A0A9P5U659_9AGAR|nr:PUA-like domain-containing protein [Rhodocollybia butyracea]
MSDLHQSQYWLLKAEPDSRIVKGKDVKFSVDDFESVKTSPWEGVRNYEARNIMQKMKVGDNALFYHSNCKNPGIAAFAEVSKEAYPDYTAWDSSHPYYDPKSDEAKPKWFMVDLTFKSRAKNFVSLALLKHISENASELPDDLAYIGADGANAIKSMDLITRGRLSVQQVQKPAWDTITLLAERGGWEESSFSKAKTSKAKVKKDKGTSGTTKARGRKKAKEVEETDLDEEEESDLEENNAKGKRKSGQKRKAAGNEHMESRRSTRARTQK